MGRNEKESGGGVKVRGYEGRKGSKSGDEGGGGGEERENPNWEEGLVMRKGGVRRKKGGAISRKIAEIGFKWGRSRKKSTSRGK